MKSSVEYEVSTYRISTPPQENDDSTSYLSVLRDGAGKILSSVLFQGSMQESESLGQDVNGAFFGNSAKAACAAESV